MKTFQTFVFSLLWAGMLLNPLWAQNDRNVSPAPGPGDTSERKTALVIGNGAYADSPLPNPVNDATDLERTLKALGFAVTKKLNSGRREMIDAIRAFGDQLSGGGVGLFFYAGHGIQVDGQNYLIPIGADVRKKHEVDDEAVNVEKVLGEMAEANNRLNIVILDACRNNPFRGFRGIERGLAFMNAPGGTLIAYATAPGRTAEDGLDSRNSPFTASLLNQMQKPGLKIEEVFKQVRIEVLEKTNRTQEPWESTSLRGDFYFIPPVSQTQQTTSGEKRPTGITGLEFISGGEFRMGDNFGEGANDEKPAHTVTVSDFYLGNYEVTFGEYDRFCEATGRNKPDDRGWGRGNRPAINVSWYDAVEYCNWRSERERLTPCYSGSGGNIVCNFDANGYRLPTEAEWEYAAREGGKKVRFGNGKDIADPAEINFDGSASYKKSYSVAGVYRQQTVAVGTFSPNRLELYDMSGNVWEWCWDWYGSYGSGAGQDPRGASGGSSRVLRGGSWNSNPRYARAANRYYDYPNSAYYDTGFRLARTR